MAHEIKPTTFRVSEEVKEQFNKVIKEQGWKNQDEALSKLIHIQEIEQAKIVISDRKTEIETFETHLHALSEVYRMSLQLNQDAEERIKSAYATTLESNQKTIQDLQEKVESLKQSLADAERYQDENYRLEQDIERIRTEMAKTDTLCNQYKDKNDTLNGLLTEYKADHEENTMLRKKLKDMDKLQAEIEHLKLQHSSDLQKLQADTTQLKQQQESELRLQGLELKEKQQEHIEALKNKHHEELEQATADYKVLLQELDTLRQENYSLKEKLLTANKRKPRANAKKDE